MAVPGWEENNKVTFPYRKSRKPFQKHRALQRLWSVSFGFCLYCLLLTRVSIRVLPSANAGTDNYTDRAAC